MPDEQTEHRSVSTAAPGTAPATPPTPLGNAGPAAGTTPAATPDAKPTAGAEETIAALRKELDDLRAKMPDADTIAEKVRKHPSFQQSQRALIANQVRLQMQEETEKRTAAIDELEADGVIDPQEANKRRRAIKGKVEQEFAGRQPPALEDDSLPPGMPGMPQGGMQPDWNALGVQLIQDSGLTVTDIPELKTQVIPFNKLPGLIAEKLAAKRVEAQLTAKQQEWMKQYEEEKKKVRDAEKAGGATPPPTGGAAPPNNLNPYEVDTRDLYRKGLAR